jgi:phage/plasmid-like protein (TIGR03299 family)
MAHEIETMMYAGETPWHGLGVFVGQKPVTSEVALRESGLDWTVNKIPLQTAFNTPISTHCAIERETDGKVLGVVGSKYRPMQNGEAFSFLDSLVSEGEMRYHTAGSLRGGQRVWLLGKIGSHEVVPNDRVDQFVMLYNSHDGSSALRVLWTEVRVVCANTARMALSSAKSGDGIAVRHTVNMERRVSEAAKVLGLAKSAAEVTADFHKRLAATAWTDADFKAFIESLVPDREIVEKGQRNTRRENVRDDLLDLWNGKAIGSEIAGVSGTAWAAYNAVTEYVNHHSSVKSHKDGLRFENVMFGAGNDLVTKANSLLLAAV